MYSVLVPRYSPTGQTFTSINPRNGQVMQSEWQRVEWEKLGTASSMKEAKKRFGGRPVLERLG